MNFNRLALHCTGLVALAALPAAALAQDAAPPAPPAAAEAETIIEVSDAQLRSFAGAVVELSGLQQEFGPRLQAASPEEQPAIQQEAQTRAMAVVQKHQLDAQTFNGIAQAAQQDAELAQKIDIYVRERAAPAQ